MGNIGKIMVCQSCAVVKRRDMNRNRKRFIDGCFCGDWLDFDVKNDSDKCEDKTERHRKDLQTLLAELEEIKKNFERISEKQAFLDNLVKSMAEGQA